MNDLLENYLDDMLHPANSSPGPEATPQPASAVAPHATAAPARTEAAAPPRQRTTPELETATPKTDASAAPDRWLIFHLGGQHYALAVDKLQEVLAWLPLTPVPCAPRHVLGLVHRRGAVIPVVDIRHPLGLDDGAPTPSGALVLLPSAIGLAVDAIGDVFVPGDDRQAPPSVGTSIPAVRALSHHARETVVLLDAAALATTATPPAGTVLA